jgi:hypothetical protein
MRAAVAASVVIEQVGAPDAGRAPAEMLEAGLARCREAIAPT